MERVWALVNRIADTDVPVLLIGESGVGKDVIARRIHATKSHRADGDLSLKITARPSRRSSSRASCSATRRGVLGAHAEKPAVQARSPRDHLPRRDRRDGSPPTSKLLQVLQDEEFYRVGGKRSVRVDARVVVATNRNLDAAIRQGTFREDLFYRLNVVTIRVPPLRERREEIGPLVRHFVDKYRQRYRGGLEEIPPEVMERFQAYDWPGNVRELENLVRRLVVLRDPAMVLGELEDAGGARATDLERAGAEPRRPSRRRAHAARGRAAQGRRAPRARIAEREAILRALMRTGWNKRKAAKRLQVSYKALLYKIKDCGIVDPRDAATIE